MLNGRGKGLVAGAVFLVVVGTLLNISQLFSMAAALVTLTFLSLLMAIRCARRVSIRITSPEFVPARTPFEITVEVFGPSLTAEMKVTPTLCLPGALRLLELSPQAATDTGQTWSATLEALERGLYDLKDVDILVQDPIGLAQAKASATDRHELVVWPLPVDPGAAMARSSRESPSGQEMVSRKAVDGSNIYGVRPWAPGDTARRVHWPSTARLGSLAVLEFEMEQTRDLLVFLDTRRLPPQCLNAFETACGIASFILQSAWRTGLKGELVGVDGPPSPHHPNARLLPEWLALTGLALAKPDSDVPLAAAVEQALIRNPSPGSLIIVTAHPAPEMLADVALVAPRAGTVKIIAVTSGAKTVERNVNIGGTSIVYVSDGAIEE